MVAINERWSLTRGGRKVRFDCTKNSIRVKNRPKSIVYSIRMKIGLKPIYSIRMKIGPKL